MDASAPIAPSSRPIRNRSAKAVALAVAWILALPAAVSAEVLIGNFMEGSVASSLEGPRFFDYQLASQQLWETDTDWNGGTYSDTTLVGQSVELAPLPDFELCLNSGGPDYTGTDGTFYQADAFASGGGTYFFPASIANTDDDPLWHRIRYAFSAGGVPSYTYTIPVPAPGGYEVEVGIVESFNFPPYQNQTDLTIEGVQVLDDFDPYNTTGGRWNATYHTFTTTTADSNVDLLIEHAGWYGALTFVCVRSLPGFEAVGTWTSPVIDTLATGTNVFGLVGGAATTPPGTEVRYRLSFGATPAAAAGGPFTGPDGTIATWYDANDPIGYTHDFGGQFVAVRAELSSTDSTLTPTLDQAWFTFDLTEVSTTTTSMTVVSDPVGQSGWLLRVRADEAVLAGTTGTVELLSSSGSGDAALGTDHPSTQVDIVSGVPTQTIGPPFAVGPAAPHSIRLDETAMVGGGLLARWQASIGGILVIHDFDVTFV
ncbi:MAG: malectin domain-containing carbohydrate-binding protein [Actinomycetota bacterium]